MATAKSIAIRKATALQAIEQALGVPVMQRHRDPAMAEALTLEAIAAALEAKQPKAKPARKPRKKAASK